MKREDFYACTPLQFTKVVEAWSEVRQMEMRSGWEQTRFLCTCVLQPYAKSALKPWDVAVFPWEKEEVQPMPEVSIEETRRRFEEAKKRWGLN